MVAKRIIPCLDVKGGKVVKGINFEGVHDVGDAVEMGLRYCKEGADELVYLDISASVEERHTFTGLVEKIALGIDIPFTVGGGISTLDDASRLLDCGADKISVNSAAVADPELISRIASKYGSQFIICAIDAKCVDGVWRVVTRGGGHLTGLNLFTWAREAQERGAGEILFTSMDHDGTKSGYAWPQCAELAENLSIPVIASGGAGCIQDFMDVFTKGRADAALAASIFHYGQISIKELKNSLISGNIPIRI